MRHITVVALSLLVAGTFTYVPSAEAGIIVTVGKSVDEDDGDDIRTTRDDEDEAEAFDRDDFLDNAIITPQEALGVSDSVIEAPDDALVVPIDEEDDCLTFNEDTLICDDPTGSSPGSADGGGLGDEEVDGDDEIDALGCSGSSSTGGPLGLVALGLLLAALRIARRSDASAQ